ncbi:MAG: metal ABC transporter ATP-binding protein [Chitinispirillaceae bacterium]
MEKGQSDIQQKGPKQVQCRGCCTKIEDLGVTLGGNVIVEKVNLHFHCGELLVIIGPNGAGKSTLFKAISGEVPFTGKIKYHRFGSSEQMVPRIGYVPQRITFDTAAPLDVEDLFAVCLSGKPRWLFTDKKIRQIARNSLAVVESSHLLRRKLGHLSGGELQRVLLSLALTPRPDILLLDEPVSGVDAAGLNLFYSMISELRAKYDLSIVLISHDLSLSARYADRLVFFNKTVVSSGSPAEVQKDERVRSYFGTFIGPASGPCDTIDHHKSR